MRLMCLQNIVDHYNDTLVGRKFDNFKFVDFHRVMKNNSRTPEAVFALMVISDAYISATHSKNTI